MLVFNSLLFKDRNIEGSIKVKVVNILKFLILYRKIVNVLKII